MIALAVVLSLGSIVLALICGLCVYLIGWVLGHFMPVPMGIVAIIAVLVAIGVLLGTITP